MESYIYLFFFFFGPNLESVDLGFWSTFPVTGEDLIRCFDDKLLKRIRVSHNMRISVDRDLVSYLARYNSLEELTLRTLQDVRTFNGVFHTNEHLFRNIRYLNLQIDASDIPPLVRSIQPADNLIALHLIARGNSVNTLPHVCELRSLQVLCIYFDTTAQWPETDILALRRLESIGVHTIRYRRDFGLSSYRIV